jgi:hypothetical protein
MQAQAPMSYSGRILFASALVVLAAASATLLGGGGCETTCLTDADCGAGEICGHPTAHTGACSGGVGAACSVDADCAAGYICGFPESDGCSAKGECFEAPQVVCMAYAAGCACDGTEIDIACNGLPSGYAPKPLAYEGMCHDACTAEYPCLSSVSCASDADCAALGSQCDTCMHLCGCGGGGGKCCPVGWMMYGCTYPDGGAGLACHNPALGCASSMTCGEGCDTVVTGRCAGR